MKKALLIFLIACVAIISKAQVGSQFTIKSDTISGVWIFKSLAISNSQATRHTHFPKDSTANKPHLSAIVVWNLVDTTTGTVKQSKTFSYSGSAYNDWWNSFNSGFDLANTLYQAEGLTPLDSNKVNSIFLNTPPFQ